MFRWALVRIGFIGTGNGKSSQSRPTSLSTARKTYHAAVYCNVGIQAMSLLLVSIRTQIR